MKKLKVSKERLREVVTLMADINKYHYIAFVELNIGTSQYCLIKYDEGNDEKPTVYVGWDEFGKYKDGEKGSLHIVLDPNFEKARAELIRLKVRCEAIANTR